jgi:hypothetical protein
MTDRDLRKRLLLLHAPDEIGAERRAWSVVRIAFEERQPERRARLPLARPLLAAAVAVALVAAVANPPVLRAIRDAVTRERQTTIYREALFSLPAPGRLLVNSARGPWVVRPDGSRRLLGRYREASWSPRGLFLTALGRHELVALEPGGRVRWSLARTGRLASPRWSPELNGSTRIAYLRGQTLRVVAGDNTGDRLLAPRVAAVAPAWRPGQTFTLAYATARGRVEVVEPDRKKVLWRSRSLGPPVAVAWSSDGARLFVLLPGSVVSFDAAGRLLGRVALPGRGIAIAPRPRGRDLAVVVRMHGERSAVVLVRGGRGQTKRLVFGADGVFDGATWSPDGRWILVDWQSADAFMFVTPQGRQKLVSDIDRQFSSGRAVSSFPVVGPESWCCRVPSS